MKLCFGFALLGVLATTFHAAESACADVQLTQYCKVWKNEGYCAEGHRYRNYMASNCKKTCVFCQDCSSAPCVNGGACRDSGDSFTCSCPLGFEGKTCSKVNACATKPCKNGGVCTNSGSSFECSCVGGYSGKKCETAPKPTKECKNSDKYDRNCQGWIKLCVKSNIYYGFMQDHCSKTCGFCKKVTPCTKKPCKNRGVCTNSGSSFKCRCVGGYSGKTCETVSGSCNDIEDFTYCQSYKNYCSNPEIAKNCQKTCGICSNAPQCGHGPNKLASGRVIGGDEAVANSWPWQVAIDATIPGQRIDCGGTLIAKRWVLTAAHCLKKKKGITESTLKVTLGEHDKSKNENREQRRRVLRIVRHPNYNPVTKDNDIALLELHREAVLNEYVGLACLPTAPPDPDNSICYITGFGKTYGLALTGSLTLQEAELPVVTNEQCAGMNNLGDGDVRVTKNMLCAGSVLDVRYNTSGCQGDSGGPFVCMKNNIWYLQGVVSWGSTTCVSFENYTVFARVTRFLDWIKQTIS